MKLDPQTLKKLLGAVASTQPDEIGCEECYAHLDRFAELELTGKSTAEAMPLIKEHMDRCACCRDELSALLEALRATEAAPDAEGADG